MKHPILEPTATLSYIIGVIKGDGCCYWQAKKEGVIQLAVHDKPFADSFSGALMLIGLSPYMMYTGNYSTTKWSVRAKSKIFVAWYKALSLDAIRQMLYGDKGKTLAFFRGLYESEGSLVPCSNSTRYYITIANKNEALLHMVNDLLSQYGFPLLFYKIPDARNHCHDHYRLTLCKQQLVKDLLIQVKPCIQRKQWRENA